MTLAEIAKNSRLEVMFWVHQKDVILIRWALSLATVKPSQTKPACEWLEFSQVKGVHEIGKELK